MKLGPLLREDYKRAISPSTCWACWPLFGPVPEVSEIEVADTVIKMKWRESPGPNGISDDVWRLLARMALVILAGLFNKMIDAGTVLEVWTRKITIPIWDGKDGEDVTECANYHTIRLLCQTTKIFERVLDGKLRRLVSFKRNQCDFVNGCRTTGAIHAMQPDLRCHREKSIPVQVAILVL